MIALSTKGRFEAAVMRPPAAQDIRDAAAAARGGHAEALFDIAAALAHAAFAAPETGRAVYAAFCAGWLGEGDVLAMPDAAAVPLSRDFWDAFWDQFADQAPPDPLAITGRVVALGGKLDFSMLARSEAVAAAPPKA